MRRRQKNLPQSQWEIVRSSHCRPNDPRLKKGVHSPCTSRASAHFTLSGGWDRENFGHRELLNKHRTAAAVFR